MGQMVYNPPTKVNYQTINRSKKAFKSYLCVLSLFAVVITGIIGSIIVLRAEKIYTYARAFECLEIISASIVILTGIIQCFYYPKVLSKIQKHFKEMDHLFEKKLHTIECNAVFDTVFQQKMFYSILCYINLFVVVLCARVIDKKSIEFTIIDFTLQILSIIGHFHGLFYVELVLNLYKKVCANIELTTKTDDSNALDVFVKITKYSHKIMTHLQYYKIIHYKLWLVSQLINEYFGWSITFHYLQQFMIITHSSFFVYIVITTTEYAGSLLQLRK